MKTKSQIEKYLKELEYLNKNYKESLKNDIGLISYKHTIENMMRISIIQGKIDLLMEIINNEAW